MILVVTAYLNTLQAGTHAARSRYTQAWAIRKAAAAIGMTPEDVCWRNVDADFLEFLAARLRRSLAPSTVSRVLVACRGVLRFVRADFARAHQHRQSRIGTGTSRKRRAEGRDIPWAAKRRRPR